MLVDKVFGMIFNLFSFFGSREGFSVLNYHRVMPNTGLSAAHALHPDQFSEQLSWLKKHFVVFSLPLALELAEKKLLPRNAVVITIDDGFLDSFEYVFPLLQKHGMVATFFISTAGIKDGFLWENKISEAIEQAPSNLKEICINGVSLNIEDLKARDIAIKTLTEIVKYQGITQRDIIIEQLFEQVGRPLMKNQFVNATQIRTMHNAGMTIGAHTVNHPILLNESDSVARTEIAESKIQLESIIGEEVHYFAYPNGKYKLDFDNVHIDMVRELGFKAAFSTDWGIAKLDLSSKYRLRRFTPWDKTLFRFCMRLIFNILAERSTIKFLLRRVRKHELS